MDILDILYVPSGHTSFVRLISAFNMADSLFFFPYQTVTPSVGRQKMIISVFNLVFIIHKQTLYDYHFFQIQ